jgi:2-C-methyl-D-erythritol 4-phosphate cytidylyltransferase/2-C-methyl-D-erythritol 2,4-cyclodiphosphate synthase
MRAGALLLCGGRGERLSADGPKALVPLAGRPLFAWSLEALQRTPSIEAIVVVGPVARLRAAWDAAGGSPDRVVAWTEGGSERQDSVARGLSALPRTFDLVAVHDGARALVTPELVERVVADAAAHGAAVAAVPLEDTLKRAEAGSIEDTVPRAGLWRAQTPQAFRREWLEEAHAAATSVATDDAALLERAGRRVHVTEGDAMNLKITRPGDLALAEAWLESRREASRGVDRRIGFGYDAHRIAPGRPLVLGGERFESAWGLEGHSDADVLLHAIGDALLGAAALGDLGTHFPPSDPRWKDVSSLELLRRIRALLDARAIRIANVDATLVAEEPRLAPARERICANVAEALGVTPDRVSVKATTNERLGALGRGEGLAACAVAFIEAPAAFPRDTRA